MTGYGIPHCDKNIAITAVLLRPGPYRFGFASFHHTALQRKGGMSQGQQKHRQELYKTCRFPKHRLKHAFGEVVISSTWAVKIIQ
jgi:hypothetical protein